MASTLETIATLAQAGFTKTEIVALLQAQAQQPKQQPAQQPAQQPTQQPTQQTAQQPAQQSTQQPAQQQPMQKSETEKLIEALGLKLDTLTSAVYGQNISSIGKATPQKTQDQITDDVIASIINPDGGVING